MCSRHSFQTARNSQLSCFLFFSCAMDCNLSYLKSAKHGVVLVSISKCHAFANVMDNLEVLYVLWPHCIKS